MIDITEGIRLFNHSNYFEAHDFFESLWIDSEKKDKLFLQGLIQVSVGCYHSSLNRKSAALSQLKKGIQKLTVLPAAYNDVNLTELIFDVENLINFLNSDESNISVHQDIHYPKIDYRISNK